MLSILYSAALAPTRWSWGTLYDVEHVYDVARVPPVARSEWRAGTVTVSSMGAPPGTPNLSLFPYIGSMGEFPDLEGSGISSRVGALSVGRSPLGR